LSEKTFKKSEKNQGRLRQDFFQNVAGRKPVHHRYGKVNDDDIGIKLPRQRNCFLAVARFAANRSRRLLEDQPQASPYHCIVIGKENALHIVQISAEI
jgi:hypothetical protein